MLLLLGRSFPGGGGLRAAAVLTIPSKLALLARPMTRLPEADVDVAVALGLGNGFPGGGWTFPMGGTGVASLRTVGELGVRPFVPTKLPLAPGLEALLRA